MANFMLARIDVKDFAEWKASYDSHKHARDAAGMTEKYLLQDADNPNKVTMLFDAEDLEQAKEFASSDELRETMQEAGVIGKPEIYFLKN